MSEICYHSSLGKYMTLYLKEKKHIGHKALDIKYAFVTIDRFLESINFKKTYIDKNTYMAWLETQQQYKPATIYQHVSIFRRLLIYMCNLGNESYIPRLPKRHNSGFTPYIFSKEEIKKIFDAADNLRIRERQSKTVLIAIPAIMRTLYSTGMRISEVLAIHNKDIDFSKHIIMLNETKNGCQRIAPINQSLEIVLRQYLKYRSLIISKDIDNPNSFFFVSAIGKRIARRTVSNYFRKIINDAGITYKGNHEGPRIHDLRHSACVHSLINQIDKGRDVYCTLPMLSVFMGHKNVIDTEHYLRLTADMYPEIVKLDMTVTANIGSILRNHLKTNNDEKI